MPSLTRKSNQVLVATIATPDPGEAVVQDATVKITVDDPHHIGPKKPIALLEPLLIDLLDNFIS